MKKLLSGIVAASLVAGSAGMLSAYAEESYVDNVMYSTTMEIETDSGKGGLSCLPAGRYESNTDYAADSAVFFNFNKAMVGEDYIEMNLPQVSAVEALKFRARGCIQRIGNAKITYLDNTDGIWKTALESAECSEYEEGNYNLVWKTVSLPETVRTAKVRVYPLSGDGDIRMDGLLVLGTATDDQMYGNLLYGSSVSIDASNAWVSGWAGAQTIDGKYQHAADSTIQMAGKAHTAEITYNLPEERMMNYVEVTSFYPQHGFTNAWVSVWNQEKECWEEAGRFTGEQWVTDATFGRKIAEFAKPVTASQIKITINDADKTGDAVSLSEVYAGNRDYSAKLGSLYFTTYDLEEPNPEAGSEMIRLHEDGGYDRNPGDANYGDAYDCIFFANPQGSRQPVGNEDYIEMMMSYPSDVKEVVIKTVDPNKEDKYVYSRPTNASVYYLDHKTQEWIYDGCLTIPTTDYVSSYYFANSVYADAVRVYVTGIEEPTNYFRLAGLYAVGNVRTGAKLNNGNLIKGTVTGAGNPIPVFWDGKITDETWPVGAGDWNIWIETGSFVDVNQIELVWRNAENLPSEVSVGVWAKDIGWSDSVVVSTEEAPSGAFNPVRQIITLPQTIQNAFYVSINLKGVGEGGLLLGEVIVRNADKTGYTVSDAEVMQNGNLCTLTTSGENFEGETKNYNVFYAAYQDGKLIAAAKNVLDLKPFTKRNRYATLDLSGYTGEVQLKRFVWTDAQNPYTAKTDVQTIALSEN